MEVEDGMDRVGWVKENEMFHTQMLELMVYAYAMGKNWSPLTLIL